MAHNAQDDLRITDQFDFDAFWAEYGKKISIALIALLGLGAVYLYRQYQSSSEAEQAAVMLANARDTASLEQVARSFPSSSTAAEALSRLADIYYRSGKYSDAASTYQKIMRDFPSYPLAESAKLGLAAVAEAQSDLNTAKMQYQQIINSSPNSYIVTAAKMGLARCMETGDQKKEARQLYEEVLAQGQNSPWFTQAYLRWVVLTRDMPQEKPSVTAAQTGAPASQGNLQLPSLTKTP